MIIWAAFAFACYPGDHCVFYHSEPEYVSLSLDACLDRVDLGFNFSNIVPSNAVVKWECIPVEWKL